MMTVEEGSVNDTRCEWTVRTLLDNYRHLGLPHFQRGHVWNKEAVSLLLESLYFDTPCGSIILWKPADPAGNGVALPGAEDIQHLLIDGQQRVRSIHDALSGIVSEVDEEAGTPEEGIWCLNITRLPQLAGLFQKSHLLEQPLFMKLTDPRTTKNPKFRFNLVPLDALLTENDQTSEFRWDFVSESTDDVIRILNEAPITHCVRRILDRKFYVVIKYESETENRLSDMVQLYNRINSGGMRVQAEERAFATLVSLHPPTNEWLARLFASIHGAPPDRADRQLARDEVLQRTKERSLPF